MDRSGSHVCLNPVFSKTLRCFGVFFGIGFLVEGRPGRKIVFGVRKYLILQGFGLPCGVILRGRLTVAANGVVWPGVGVIGVRLAG
jgi:hypothetical protein